MIINQLQSNGQLRLYTAGLLRREWDGNAYRAEPPNVMANEGIPTATGINSEINSISINTTAAMIWRGFFLPDQTSTSWQFRTTSDDASFLWINREDSFQSRNAAQKISANILSTEATVDNGGRHTERTVTSSNLTLNANIYYPICIFASNNRGAGIITVEFRRDGGSWISDGSNYYFHDAATDNGYHI